MKPTKPKFNSRKYSNSTAKSKYSNLTRNFQSYGSSYYICQGCALHAKNTRLTLTLTFAQLYIPVHTYSCTRYPVQLYIRTKIDTSIQLYAVRVLSYSSNLRFPPITSKVTGQVTVFSDHGISESHFLSA